MAIDFSNVKSIIIPEGNVSKITISNNIVWKKPDGNPYTVLPYLVAVPSSNAYIDLGIPYQIGCRAEYKITYKGNANIFGVFYTDERCRSYLTNDIAYFNVGKSDSTAAFPKIDGLVNGTDYIVTVVADPDASSALITIGDRTDEYTSLGDSLAWDSSPYNMYLFSVHRQTPPADGTRIIHYFKYWDANNDLILDLIPVERKSDGELGMLNNVNGEFLTNIADGTFYKELPST